MMSLLRCKGDDWKITTVVRSNTFWWVGSDSYSKLGGRGRAYYTAIKVSSEIPCLFFFFLQNSSSSIPL